MYESHLPTDYLRTTDYLRLLKATIHKERKKAIGRISENVLEK